MLVLDCKYPKFSSFLEFLKSTRDIQNYLYSDSFSAKQIQAIEQLVMDAHDEIPRLSGGTYIDEHLVPVASKARAFEVPPIVELALLLHDYGEDVSRQFIYSTSHQTRNLRTLAEQLHRDETFSTFEERLLVGICAILTKPSDDKLRRLNYKDDLRRSRAKFSRIIHGPYQSNLQDKVLGVPVNISQRFYSGIGYICDLDDNLDVSEEFTIKDLSDEEHEEKRRKFEKNKQRNTLRNLVYGKGLENFILATHQTRERDLPINIEEFQRFMGDEFFPKAQDAYGQLFGVSFDEDYSRASRTLVDYELKRI